MADFMNADVIKEESLNIDDGENSVDMTSPDATVDTVSSSFQYEEDPKPGVGQLNYPRVVVEVKKREERPIVHCNTGKISVANLMRRRRLSMSAESVQIYRRLNAQQSTPRLQIQSRLANRAPSVSASIIVRAVEQPMWSDGAPASPSVQDSKNVLMQMQPTTSRADSPIRAQSQPLQQRTPANVHTGTFCAICQQSYASPQTLKTHLKSQKHQKNMQNAA